ncbi:DivIVA domain-containing protein [Qiania dongpingensis]|uniref:Vacuolar family H+-ATPase subunit H n=1 Tax=Qiania dongpingensis TaxID=2763669 RepID=A0A7G9G4J9_9FIRM|nr:vacuolar family H+-ATPase subunit H [Qiania dongpingensis]QNM05731.1 vacuolar family H+-ATPase subunit H [Qiania dongpingensis]
MSRIEQLISEIEEYIDGCKAQPFTNNKKIIVDKDEMEELLVELRLRTPDEIKKYQKIISNKEAILSSTKEEADHIIESARADAERILAEAQAQAEGIIAETEQHTAEMVSEHEVMQQAYQQAGEVVDQANGQAQQIINDAVADSDNIREGAIRYTDDMLKGLQSIINLAIEQTTGKFNSFIDSLQSTGDIVTNNRNELQVPQAEAAPTAEDRRAEAVPEDNGVLNADMLE